MEKTKYWDNSQVGNDFNKRYENLKKSIYDFVLKIEDSHKRAKDSKLVFKCT